jgi:hypothetical protein
MTPCTTRSAGACARRLPGITCLLAAALLLPAIAAAQENAVGPPDILQFPVIASPAARGGLEMALLRSEIERGADLALCETLMRQAKQWPPPEAREFADADCLPEFRARVAANEGVFHWESNGARPTRCGADCLGRPTLTNTTHVTRPNVRLAAVRGFLHFVVEPPDDFVSNNRRVTFPFDVFLECATERGARTGTFRVTVDFGFPIIGDPGLLESLTNAIVAPLNVSARTESGIRRRLSQLASKTTETAPCSSIGAFRSPNAADDRATFDIPGSGPKLGVRPAAAAAAVAAVRDQATIEFLRITRKPLPPNVDAAIAEPGNPAAGQFTVFLNGIQRFLPPAGLALPPAGGSAPVNLCTTIDMTGADRLQVLFVNDLGGAVWSQFTPAERFGSGKPRTMTTGRTVVVPGVGKFNPVTGKFEPAKPVPVQLREFELLYRITYSPRPSIVAEPSPGGGRGGIRGRGDTVLGRAGQPAVAVDASRPPATPCKVF